MISWRWMFPAFILGAFVGIAIIAICAAGSSQNGKKWWEDE